MLRKRARIIARQPPWRGLSVQCRIPFATRIMQPSARHRWPPETRAKSIPLTSYCGADFSLRSSGLEPVRMQILAALSRMPNWQRTIVVRTLRLTSLFPSFPLPKRTILARPPPATAAVAHPRGPRAGRAAREDSTPGMLPPPAKGLPSRRSPDRWASTWYSSVTITRVSPYAAPRPITIPTIARVIACFTTMFRRRGKSAPNARRCLLYTSHPALHFRVAAGSEVDFLGFRQLNAGQQVRVDAGAVSYTHLDVYKRQTYWIPFCRFRW